MINKYNYFISSILLVVCILSIECHSQYYYCRQTNPCYYLDLNNYTKSGQYWTISELKYFFINSCNDLSQAQVESAFEAAFNSWRNVIPFSFTQVFSLGEANIKIKFATIEEIESTGASQSAIAVSYYPEQTCSGLMLLNDENFGFSYIHPTPSGYKDLQATVLHELGHILGLCHSNNSQTIMWVSRNPTSEWRTLHQYDIEGINAIYDQVAVKNKFINPDASVSYGGTVNIGYQNYDTHNEPNNEKLFAFNDGSTRHFEAQEQEYQSVERKFNSTQNRQGGWFKNNTLISLNAIMDQQIDDATYMATYKYKATINLNATAEFDGLANFGPIGGVFQYETGYATAPDPKPHNNKSYRFAGWKDAIDQPNPRQITTEQNTVLEAYYKYPHHSNTGSFANSGQRKVIKCDYGYLHLVYESMGLVWYERSTDNGATWHIMNGGKPIDKNPSKSPSIDFYYGYQRLIIVYQTWAGDNNEFAAIKAACFKLGELEFTTTVEQSYLSTYSEVNYKPVVAYASNDKIAVAWEDYGVWVLTGVLSFSTNQISWNNIICIDNYNSANINPTIAAYKTTPGTATFHLAWQNNYSTIRYCNLTAQSNGSFLVSAVDQVSQGCGFPVNYYPSINVSNSNDVQLVWIGTPYYGSSYRKTLSRSRTTNWSSSFAQYGNNVLSPDVAFYTGSSVVSWSENPSGNTFTNKFIKYGSVKTAGTTGKDVRVFNASTLQDMHLVSFTTNSLPYAFTHSANLNSINKDNSLVMASGVQAVAFKDGVEYFFRIGDIYFNGSNIDFENFEDTVGILSLEDLNTNLITNSFTTNETNNLVYSIEYGVTDSVLALVQLQNKFISFKVELIDQITGAVVAELNNIQMDGNNIEKLKTTTFSFNITGLPSSSLAIRLNVNNDFEPEYASAIIKSDESVLLKSNLIVLNLSGTETVKEYALDQNYPNPFNPSTKIKYSLKDNGKVSLKIFNSLGEEVRTLVNEIRPAGNYEVEFNASELPSGVYIYSIQTGEFVSSKKMILLK